MVKKRSSYKGLQKHIRRLKTPRIDVWKNMYRDRRYHIDMEIPEFTCICPKTGLPDFAVMKLQYIPDEWCAELKSFKLYLVFYRNIGIFHEHVVNKILEDFVKAASPHSAHIELVFNPRGGITTTVKADYEKD